MHFFKQPKFPIFLFLFAGLSTFILLPALIFLLRMTMGMQNITIKKDDVMPLKEFKNDDPLVTRVPEPKDVLKGPIISDRDPSLGSDSAPIKIVIYSDFTCSFCKTQEEVIKKITAEYKDKVKIIWKDYPENKKSSASYLASVAARCSFDQGKFWPYHDRLFASSNLSQEKFIEIAKEMSLDMNKFNSCIEDKNTRFMIDQNMEEANALEITGVPSIYVNNMGFTGDVTYDELKKIIDLKING